MKIKDLIEQLNQYDPEIEVVVNIDNSYISPKLTKDIVPFKHNFNGVFYKDDAIVLSER